MWYFRMTSVLFTLGRSERRNPAGAARNLRRTTRALRASDVSMATKKSARRTHRASSRRCAVAATAVAVVLIAIALCVPFSETGLILWFEQQLSRCCKAAHMPVLDADALPWADEVRLRWREIRDELHAYERSGGRVPNFHELEPQQLAFAREGNWWTLWLLVYGQPTELAARFPQTMAILHAAGIASSIMFSILPVGYGVSAHRGPFKGVLRYHLALEVPQVREGETLALLIANESDPADYMGAQPLPSVRWEELPFREGGHHLFDDSFPHKVVNTLQLGTAGRRVVLFVDVPRHDCGFVLNFLLRVIANRLVRLTPRGAGLVQAVNKAHGYRNGRPPAKR